jgi:hypothetical protein
LEEDVLRLGDSGIPAREIDDPGELGQGGGDRGFVGV